MDQEDEEPSVFAFQLQIEAVSQQVANVTFIVAGFIQILVAANDPSHVTPQEIDQRRVWVRLVVAVLMVHSVNSDPSSGAVLQVAHAQDRERVFHPLGAFESAVGEQPVIANRDAEHAEDKVPGDSGDQSRPSEQIRKPRWDKRGQRDQVDQRQHDHVLPHDSQRLSLFGAREPLRIDSGFADGHCFGRDGSRTVVVGLIANQLVAFRGFRWCGCFGSRHRQNQGELEFMAQTEARLPEWAAVCGPC